MYYVVTGGKDVNMATAKLEAIDPDTGAKLGSVEFMDNHVEAMALEKNGPRIFINLAQTNQLAVVDRKTMKVIHTWPVPPAKQNAMVAFDETAHRLYVVCRDPDGGGHQLRHRRRGLHRSGSAPRRRSSLQLRS